MKTFLKGYVFGSTFAYVFLSAKFSLAWTLPIPSPYTVTNGFWECAVGCYHLGDDMVPTAVDEVEGTEVRSIGDGTVVEVTYNATGGNYGGRVLIEYETAATTVVALYGHLGRNTTDPETDDIFVSVGEEVSEGQVIGRLGSSSENGGWIPHLHFGVHRGSYIGGAQECNRWTYAGYTASAYSPGDPCYCAVMDNWKDPSEFLGTSPRDLRIISGSVSAAIGVAGYTEFTWNLSADGGHGAPITATVIIRNPVTGIEYPFIMDYVLGTASPFQFRYYGELLSAGTYQYRFQIETCADSVSETAWRSGPCTTEAWLAYELRCDGVDNDCDGLVDENATEERCDGRDNDCDGEIDESLTRSCTRCGNTGTQTCVGIGGIEVWTVCSATPCPPPPPDPPSDDPPPPGSVCSPSAEICDNADNDCDGLIDEEIARSCSNECGNTGTETCASGSFGACSAAACPPPAPPPSDPLPPACTPTAETCDNMDNDCDGVADEGVIRSCSNECGNTGTQTCGSGSFSACSAAACPPPAPPPSDPPPTDPPVPPPADTPPLEMPDPPAAPSIIGPVNGTILQVAAGGLLATVLSWDPVSGAASYEYQIRFGGTSESGSLIEQSITSGNSYVFSRGSDYYGIQLQWKVRAIGATGNAGAWSEIRTFFMSYIIGTIARCTGSSCPAPDAWYLITDDIYDSGLIGIPPLLIADWISAACTAGRTATSLTFSQISGYHRSARFGGCP